MISKSKQIYRLLAPLFIVFFCFIFSTASAQDNSDSQIIKGFIKFREMVFHKNKEGVKNLGLLHRSMSKISLNNEVINDLMASTYWLHKRHQNDWIKIRNDLETKYNPKLISRFSDEFLKYFVSSGQLIYLIHLGILEKDYPYNINLQSDLIEELRFYNIKNHDSVLEIGAGSGMFGLHVCTIYDSLSYALNELSAPQLKLINEMKYGYYDKLDDSIIVREGHYKSTNFEDIKFDKIIMRNTFHHIDKKKHILQSIIKSLHQDSEIIIYEKLKHDKHESCPKALDKKKLIKKLNKVNLVIIDTYQNKNNYYMKLKLNK